VAPAIAGSSILFLQRAGRKLRELLMDSYAVAYTGPFQDVTVLSEHVTLGGITQMAYQQELDSIIWAVRADGTLVGITYEKTQDVVAAHRHVTDGLFQSVASIPHPDQDQDQVWVIVKRTINGSQKRYVEYFDTKGGYYGNLGVDCGLTYPTSSKNIVSSSAAFLFDITGNSRLTYYCPAHGLAPAGSVSISSVLLDGGVGVNPFNGTFSVESVLDADHFTVLYGGNVDGESGTGGSFPVSVSATATLTGLSHLEAKSVDIVGNGAVYPQKTVASGQVTGLNPTVTVAEVGLHFDSTIETMRPDAGQDAGTAQGEQKSINDITVRLYKSLGCTIQGDLLTFRKPADPMGLPPPMFTGDKRVTNLGWSTEGQITIQQTQPLPMTVLAIITEISVGG
jgi:hypothetical protein